MAKVHSLYASATLAGSGSYTASGAVFIDLQRYITLYCTYTRGASSGAVTVRVELTPDGSVASPSWFRQSVVRVNSITAGSDTNTDTQANQVVYTSTSGSAETFIITLSGGEDPHRINAHSLRVQAAESGVVGTPGTFAAIARTSSEA